MKIFQMIKYGTHCKGSIWENIAKYKILQTIHFGKSCMINVEIFQTLQIIYFEQTIQMIQIISMTTT
jgi:hypothetical protein